MFGIFAIAVATATQSGMIARSSSPPPITVVEAPPAPMPPIVMAPPAPPSPPSVVRSPIKPAIPIPVRVRVTAGPQVLFSDTMRVSRVSGASFQQSRSEAAETTCPTERYFFSSQRNSLNVNLYLREDTTAGSMLNVSVSWTRPSRGVGCGGEGSRQVQLTQTVPLAAGQTMTLQGDGGLTVTVSC